jgi:carboxymethylenebutenolidase
MDTPYPNSHLVTPRNGNGPGILAIHAWWGLNQFLKDFCDRLAGEGFVVFAPDLYNGKVATTIEEAKLLRSKLKQKKAYSDLLGMVDYLHRLDRVTSNTVGIIGFSLGARLALELSTEHSKGISPVVVFYGNSNVDYSSSQAAYLGHFAENDKYVALSGIKRLEKNMNAAGRPFTFHIYQGTGHWFFEKDQANAYNEQAAQLAWDRTVDFLNQHMKA